MSGSFTVTRRGFGTLAAVCLAAACGGSAGTLGATGSGHKDDGGAIESSADSGAPGTSATDTGGAPPPDSSPTAPDSGAPSGVDAGPSIPTGQAGQKRGIAYGDNSDADLAALAPGISWWYNWSPAPDSSLSSGYTQAGVEFVPMIWGGTFNTTTLATQVPADAKYLLTFNEPNFGAQSNLTPQKAASLWPKVQAFAQSKGLKIVSPAVNYCGGSCNETDPYVWLSDFFAACQGCEVDYVAVHWYSCTLGALTGYVQKFETEFNKQIWLTEFSCLDNSLPATVANEESYMKQAVAALEADPMVFRYSWFTGRDTGSPAISLLGSSGTLTALGQEYIAAPPQK
jgi:hypothetical protein